jgi:hypothetical protein
MAEGLRAKSSGDSEQAAIRRIRRHRSYSTGHRAKNVEVAKNEEHKEKK